MTNYNRISQPVKIVQKSWGREEWLANSPLYCGKILYINQNDGTSIHHHKYKFETMYVLEGEFRIFLEGDIFNIDVGDILHISPYQIHKIDGLEQENKLLEISTQHFDDDSIRHGTDLNKYLLDK